MEKFEWLQKYSVGIEGIDEQHQRYFELANEIIKMTGQDDIPAADILAKIDELNNYAIYHFATEEKLFKEYAYPEVEEHLEQHRAYEERMDEFMNKVRKESGSKDLMLEIAEFAGSWLMNHIMDLDQKYAIFFREKGVSRIALRA